MVGQPLGAPQLLWTSMEILGCLCGVLGVSRCVLGALEGPLGDPPHRVFKEPLGALGVSLAPSRAFSDAFWNHWKTIFCLGFSRLDGPGMYQGSFQCLPGRIWGVSGFLCGLMEASEALRERQGSL